MNTFCIEMFRKTVNTASRSILPMDRRNCRMSETFAYLYYTKLNKIEHF